MWTKLPGHIGLISENQPGITDDMQSGSGVRAPLLGSISRERQPLSSSRGLLTGNSPAD